MIISSAVYLSCSILAPHFPKLRFGCISSNYGVSWDEGNNTRALFEYAQKDYLSKWVKLMTCSIHLLLWINRIYNVMPEHLLFRLIWCRIENGHPLQKLPFGIIGWPELPVGIVPMYSYKNDLAGELVAGECFGFVMVFFCTYRVLFDGALKRPEPLQLS